MTSPQSIPRGILRSVEWPALKLNEYQMYVHKVQSESMYRSICLCLTYKCKLLNHSYITIWKEKYIQKYNICVYVQNILFYFRNYKCFFWKQFITPQNANALSFKYYTFYFIRHISKIQIFFSISIITGWNT